MSWHRFQHRGGSIASLPALVALLAAGLLGGCGEDSAGPSGPTGPDLSTPEAAIAALEEFYGRRLAEEAISLLSPDYRFYPAVPESIPFLEAGETSWGYDVETSILSLLLREERTTWIDQVLLEVTRGPKQTTPDGRVEVEAKVELSLLIGVDLFLKGVSRIVLTYEIDGQGNHFLVEERESIFTDENGIPIADLTVGRNKARVLEDRGGG